MDKNVIILIVVIVTVILIFLPIWIRKQLLNKMIRALDHKDFNTLYETLDSKLCVKSYPLFNREFMRLNGYLAQEDDKKIQSQFDYLKSLNLAPKQLASVSTRGFYYYFEKRNKKKAEEMLALSKDCVDERSYKNMEIQDSILLKKEAKYIAECKKMLESMWDGSSSIKEEDKYPIGTMQYMIGLQYSYLNEYENANAYLEGALQNLKNTPYEVEISTLLKNFG